MNIASSYVEVDGETKQENASKYAFADATPPKTWTKVSVAVTSEWATKDENGTAADITKVKGLHINPRTGQGTLYVRYINIIETPSSN